MNLNKLKKDQLIQLYKSLTNNKLNNKLKWSDSKLKSLKKIDIINEINKIKSNNNNNNKYSIIISIIVTIVIAIIVIIINNNDENDNIIKPNCQTIKLNTPYNNLEKSIDQFVYGLNEDNHVYNHALSLQIGSTKHKNSIELYKDITKIIYERLNNCKYLNILNINNDNNSIIINKEINKFLLNNNNNNNHINIIHIYNINNKNSNRLLILKDYIDQYEIEINENTGELVSSNYIGFIFSHIMSNNADDDNQNDLDLYDLNVLKWHRNFIGRISRKLLYI